MGRADSLDLDQSGSLGGLLPFIIIGLFLLGWVAFSWLALALHRFAGEAPGARFGLPYLVAGALAYAGFLAWCCLVFPGFGVVLGWCFAYLAEWVRAWLTAFVIIATLVAAASVISAGWWGVRAGLARVVKWLRRR